MMDRYGSSPLGAIASSLRSQLSAESLTLQTHPVNLPIHQPLRPPVKKQQQQQQQRQEEAEEQHEETEQQKQPTLVEECQQLVAVAGPLFIEGIAAIGGQLVATSCVGQLPDPAALSALVLAEALYNVSGYSVVSGLASALETLCGQAYGAKNYHMLAVMLVRAQLVCLLATLPTVLVWASGSLAVLLPKIGQDPDIATPTSMLLQLLVPSLLLSIISDTVAQYLLAQGEAWPLMVGSLVGLALSPLYNWGWVYGLWGWQGLGLPGAAFAAVAVQGTLVLLLLAYMLYRDCWRGGRGTGTWAGFRLGQALQGCCSYLTYGLPCVMMVCLEWWVWEALVLMAGLLPDAEIAVAVMGLSTQISLLPWMLCYSMGTAIATRAAQALGAGSAVRARRIFRVSCLLVLLCSVVLCAGMWCLRHVLVTALTQSAMIQEQLKSVLPVVVANIICDGQVAVLSGLLRAAGRQGTGAAINWVSYWVVGLPVSWLLGFTAKLGVMGLRVGLAIAVACQAVVLHLLITFKFDWDEEVQRAQVLVGGDVSGEVMQEDGDVASGGHDSSQLVPADGGPADLTAPLLQPAHISSQADQQQQV